MNTNTFKIVRHIATLKEYGSGWTKEVNLVEWNKGNPKFDIRDWNPAHDMMSRGVTLTKEEAGELLAGLIKYATMEL